MNFYKEKLSRRVRWQIATICFSLIYGQAYAEPLTLDTALKLAEQYAPTLRANSAQIEGAENMVSASGILPNPKLFVGLDNYPISGDAAWSITQEGMTMQKIGVMQDFPNRAKRQAEVELAKAELGSVTAQTEILRIELRQKVASAWFKRFYLERKLALYDELFSENRLLSQMTQTQVTSGRTMVADALNPRLESNVLLDQKDDLLRDLKKAKLELHRLVSAEPTENISQIETLSTQAPIISLDTSKLYHHLHQHPELKAYQAEKKTAEAKLRQAQALQKPDWGIEFAYQHRAPEFGDMIGVQLTTELPVFSKKRSGPLIQAALAEQNRITADQEVKYREHLTLLDEGLSDLDALDQQINRTMQKSIPLAKQKVNLQLASYQAGKTNLTNIIAARQALLEQRLRLIDLQQQQAVTKAQLYFAFEEPTLNYVEEQP
ncbi:TPA: TolC family protein [Acinetobacter baumannii]|uniref:TolC family protein n=1 Tax=Acinetobacter baumannii TaxID=470 RepID=UPI001C5C6DC8|nr:TolC family protein [Acinetobacter baumannii]HAV6057383.1 TolC family protein [Acinetobacter baumannii]HAV6071768.1 TolC family protein [Acinetobacter baumannii]HAV6120842.1 TolC family protein [Acinetobacter baumannii]HAV6148479.1 TolC family protein [Acinetobacter baumannii]